MIKVVYRKDVEDVKRIDGKTYYTFSEIAALAKVHERTLRRWIQAGELSHFLFQYRKTPKGPVLFRLEPPEETEETWPGESVYVLKGGEDS